MRLITAVRRLQWANGHRSPRALLYSIDDYLRSMNPNSSFLPLWGGVKPAGVFEV